MTSAHACSRSFFLFATYYFTKFFTFRPAPFHEAFYDDFQALVTGELKDAAWIAYRESAKASIAKIGLAWIIAQKQVIDALRNAGEDVGAWGQRLYVNVDSYDKANAKSILFDVVTELHGNELLITDFGHLCNQPRTKTRPNSSTYRKSSRRTASASKPTQRLRRCAAASTSSSGPTSSFAMISRMRSPQRARLSPRRSSSARRGAGRYGRHGASLTLGNYIKEGVIGYIRRSVTTSNGAVRFIPSRARTASRSRQIGPHRFIHIDAGRPIAVDELQQSLAAIQHRPIEVLRALGEYRSLPCRYIYIIEVVGHWLIGLPLWGADPLLVEEAR